MAIKAGTVNDFESSMAEAMEEAMRIEYETVKVGQQLPTMGIEDRRILFAAIAQGVVRHLKNHLDSFKVNTEVSGVAGASATSNINDLEVAGTLHP